MPMASLPCICSFPPASPEFTVITSLHPPTRPSVRLLGRPLGVLTAQSGGLVCKVPFAGASSSPALPLPFPKRSPNACVRFAKTCHVVPPFLSFLPSPPKPPNYSLTHSFTHSFTQTHNDKQHISLLPLPILPIHRPTPPAPGTATIVSPPTLNPLQKLGRDARDVFPLTLPVHPAKPGAVAH